MSATRLSLLLVLAGLFVMNASAQSVQPRDAGLFRTVKALDAQLFDAYNNCQLDKFESFFTDDVEFYHDQGGVTLGKRDLTDAVKKNICGKVTRELVADKLEVYPMRGFGAVEIGVHLFHHPADPKEPDGEAQFIHLWQNKDGVWKITRVISFDHHAAATK